MLRSWWIGRVSEYSLLLWARKMFSWVSNWLHSNGYSTICVISSWRFCFIVVFLKNWFLLIEIYWHTTLCEFMFYNFIYLLAALCLSCSMWDLVPRSRIEPRPPALVAWSLNHWTTREVQCCYFWCVAKGPRKVAHLAMLPFSVCKSNKLSESKSNLM